MTYIESKIQDGYMTRRGWRGRWITIYRHDYGGKPEKSERFHIHPWKWSISIVIRGRLTDEINMTTKQVPSCWNPVTYNRLPKSIKVYHRRHEHRILSVGKNTMTIFIGLFRHKRSTRNADVKVKEGYCHYTELGEM